MLSIRLKQHPSTTSICGNGLPEPLRGYSGEKKVGDSLEPEGGELWGDVGEGGGHRVELDEGEGGWGCGEEVVCGVPGCGQQFEGVGDARNEDKSHGEEGDEYDGCFTVVE